MSSNRSLHQRLSSQQALIGLLQTHPSAVVAEMAGMCGYDFLLLDTEHGIFNDCDLVAALRVLASVDVLAMVRLAGHDTQAVGRCMDMGAGVIVVPNVSTADQARTLVQAMTYPPGGTRGAGAALHRATRYGLDATAHLNAPREGVGLLVIIESALGVRNADAILAVDGIDGVIIGPMDLSADLGCIGDFSQPSFAEAVSRIEQAARTQFKVLGAPPHPGCPAEALFARGHRLLIAGADTPLICEAMSGRIKSVKAALDGVQGPDRTRDRA